MTDPETLISYVMEFSSRSPGIGDLVSSKRKSMDKTLDDEGNDHMSKEY
jgi:hypothetical protein